MNKRVFKLYSLSADHFLNVYQRWDNKQLKILNNIIYYIMNSGSKILVKGKRVLYIEKGAMKLKCRSTIYTSNMSFV